MFKKVLGTISTKALASLISLAVIMLSANILGAEAVGVISINMLGITIVLLVNNFIGGAALIYLVPRIDVSKLFLPSYCWALISSASVTFILYCFNLISNEYTVDVLILSAINSLASVNFNILLGKEKIKAFNIIALLQNVFQLVAFVLLLFLFRFHEVYSYFIALYFGFGAAFALSFLAVVKHIKFSEFGEFSYVIRQVLKYGSFVQFSNIIQLLNYRLSYYIIDFYFGKSMLGIFAIAVQLSEGLWLISKSIATVQYSRIANIADLDYSKELTIKFVKITFISTLAILIPLVALPEDIFRLIFGKPFGNISIVIIIMSPGIIAVAVNSMFSHFFSGTGRHYLNTIGSAIGFAVTFTAGFLLIPAMGIKGAAITASLSYILSLIYQMFMFARTTSASLHEYILKYEDLKYFLLQLKKYLG